MPALSPQNPLHRDLQRGMFGGVCAGIARWLGWDPTLVRVIYVIAAIISAAFPGALVYLLLWVIMPAD